MGGTLQKHGETAEDLSNVQPFGTIRILSYNLFMRPPAPHFTHNVVNDLKDERLEIFQQQLKDYDVICLQECFGAFSSRRGRLIEEARRQGFFWHVLSPMSLTSGFLVDGGLLILSKVPISQSAYTIFSRGKFSDALAAKGAIYARMELAGDVVLHVFTTHLQASYHVYGVAPSAEVRARQLDALVHFISECTRPSSARGERSAAEAGGAAEAPGAAGAAGAGAAHAGGAQREGLGVVATPRAAHQDGQLASTPQSSQLLHRIYLPGSPHHPRGISATPGSHANASGLTMTGSSVLSDSDSLPVFEGSNDGIESRQIFRLLEEGVSEGSNDAWLLSHNPPPPPPQTQSAPGAAGPVLSTPAARRGDAADRSVQDSSAGKSAAPTPFLDASAKDKEAPAPAGEEEEGWSEEQDLMVLMAGKAAAQDPAPSAYEESWKRLNREGSGGLQGRCVRALARRYEVLVSKAINFSRATAGS